MHDCGYGCPECAEVFQRGMAAGVEHAIEMMREYGFTVDQLERAHARRTSVTARPSSTDQTFSS